MESKQSWASTQFNVESPFVDVHLVFVTSTSSSDPEPGTLQDGSDQEPSTKRRKLCCPDANVTKREYPGHRFVLADNSEYWESRLSRWDNDRDHATDGAGHPLLTEHVEEDELPAVHNLLQFMYFQQLGGSVLRQPRLLLQVLKLADRFLVPKCVAACIKAATQHVMECRQDQDLDTDLLLLVFGDAYKVAANEDLARQFNQLPFCAVKRWASRDELVVDHENTVLVLLDAWLGANEGTPDQATELLHQVRMLHVGGDLLLHALPESAWMYDLSWEQRRLQLLHVIRAAGRHPSGDHYRLAWLESLPYAWLAPPRTHCSKHQPSVMSFNLPVESLLETVRRAAAASRDIVVMSEAEGGRHAQAGYSFGLQVCVFARPPVGGPGASEGETLASFLELRATSLLRAKRPGSACGSLVLPLRADFVCGCDAANLIRDTRIGIIASRSMQLACLPKLKKPSQPGGSWLDSIAHLIDKQRAVIPVSAVLRLLDS